MDEIDIALTKTGLRKLLVQFQEAGEDKYEDKIYDIQAALVVINALHLSNNKNYSNATKYRTELWKVKAELKKQKKLNEELLNNVEL